MSVNFCDVSYHESSFLNFRALIISITLHFKDEIFKPLGYHTELLGSYSLSRRVSYRKISWIFEAAKFSFRLYQSSWNLTRTSTAVPSRCLSNFRAIWWLQHQIFRLRDFTRSYGKTSARGGGGGTPYVMGDTYVPRFWPPFFTLAGSSTIFLGYFSHPPTAKLSFGVQKLPIFTKIDLFGPKFNFFLDLFGSNFQRPAAHPHQFSGRVPTHMKQLAFQVFFPLFPSSHTDVGKGTIPIYPFYLIQRMAVIISYNSGSFISFDRQTCFPYGILLSNQNCVLNSNACKNPRQTSI